MIEWRLKELYSKRILREEWEVSYGRPGEKKETVIVDDNHFSTIKRYISQDPTTVKKAYDSILKSNYNRGVAKQIIDMAGRYDTGNNFFNALINKITFNELISNSNNIIRYIGQKYDIEIGLLIEFLFYEAPTKPSSGKGEAFLTCLVESGKKPAKGDVEIEGKEVEVKGISARLGGQKGYGDNHGVLKTFEKLTDRLLHKAGFREENTMGLDFNVGITQHGALNSYAQRLVKTGKVDRDEIIDVYKEAYSKFYMLASPNDFDWVDDNINNDGQIENLSKFISDFFYFSLCYYIKVEKFDYLLVILTKTFGTKSKNITGQFKIMSTENILSDKDQTLLSYSPMKAPKFGTSAPTDKFFAIRLAS